MTHTDVRPTPPALIALAWLVVALPATWGIYQTARKAAALFTSQETTTQTTTTPSR